jgi:aldose 1-epimerase
MHASEPATWRSASPTRRLPAACWLLAGLVPVCFPVIAHEPERHEPERAMIEAIEKTDFGPLPNGERATLYTITNRHGARLRLTDYGAIIVGIDVPDRFGKLENVTLSFDSVEGYLQRHPYFGATVGRYCNRIAGGQFSLGGQTYTLAVNNGPNHLHGGIQGFDRYLWQADTIQEGAATGIRFQITSPDGDEGYPGNLTVTADYLWDDDNRLTIRFAAHTDAATHVNLTNHAYFDLGGAGSGEILDHLLRVDADQFLEVDATLIPTGRFLPVADTPLDFRQVQPIGLRIEQLPDTKGYDHCYVVRGQPGQLRVCAEVWDRGSGRVMEVQTTQPGVQLYTGNHLSGDASTAGFGRHQGFCLETQHYPDTPNKPDFPTTQLNPGERLSQITTYRFFTRDEGVGSE